MSDYAVLLQQVMRWKEVAVVTAGTDRKYAHHLHLAAVRSPWPY